MQLKKLDNESLEIIKHKSEDDFYYNLFDGGYLNPEEILDNQSDIDKVRAAMNVISEYSDLLSELDDGEE